MLKIKDKGAFSFGAFIQTIRNYFTIKIDEEGAMIEPNKFKFFLLRWQYVKDWKSFKNFLHCYTLRSKYPQRLRWWLVKQLLEKEQIAKFFSPEALRLLYNEKTYEDHLLYQDEENEDE